MLTQNNYINPIKQHYTWAIDRKSDKNKFGQNGPSHGWWLNLKCHYPNICKVRKPGVIDHELSTFTTAKNSMQLFFSC